MPRQYTIYLIDIRAFMACFLLMWTFYGSSVLLSQFPPAAGKEGSTAISADSNIIERWATEVEINRGWQDYYIKSERVTHGTSSDALGKADGRAVSLGDSGFAYLQFDPPIMDGAGPDFAVFENAFDDNFLELAHVEVSSDGVHFMRFPSISLTDTTREVGTFDYLNPTKIHNLAGKYRVLYGTPFDLEDIPDTAFFDRMNVRYVKIIDVIGRVKGFVGSRDSRGFPINDPYPTPFPTGGFDLDAVAVLLDSPNRVIQPASKDNLRQKIRISPNPVTNEHLTLYSNEHDIDQIDILDISGMKWLALHGHTVTFPLEVDCLSLPVGLYYIRFTTSKGESGVIPFIKE